jgi:HlyD family secretion protein
MKKGTTLAIILLILASFSASLYYLYTKNLESPEFFETETPAYRTIVKSTLATGKITPEEEILIKPNISGLVEEVYVSAGDNIKIGDLIAKIRVIPNVGNLNAAQNQVENAKIILENQSKIYERQKSLFEKGVISANEFDNFEGNYLQALQSYEAALQNLEIVKTGSTKNMGASALTMIRSTVTGKVLDVPVKKGNQVIETNNFNEGTTIASIADVTNMIFEGKVDESEVGKIKEKMPIEITVGALPDLRFDAVLDFIAPKGNLENGAIQFDIRGTLDKLEETSIRAGLSANASIILAKVDSVLAIKEALVQFDPEDFRPFVEIQKEGQVFEKRYVELGLSDGIYVEIKVGVDKDTPIKVWNKLLDSK